MLPHPSGPPAPVARRLRGAKTDLGVILSVEADLSGTPVAVVLVTYQSARDLVMCLGSLERAAGPHPLEVVVVDNASTDASVEIARGYGAKVVENHTNLGLSRAINIGVAATGAPWLLIANPDTWLSPKSLARLLATASSDRRIGCVGPHLVNPDGSDYPTGRRFPSPLMGAVHAALAPMPFGLLLWGGSVRSLSLRGRSEHDRMAPAAPTQLSSPPPITDRIALGALTHTFPAGLVDQVIVQTGRAEQRRRLLPARVVVYFVLALALYSHAAYEEVMRCLVEGLGWAQQARRGRRSWPYWHVPGASALVEARQRLGPEPLELLFATAARPLATPATRGAWYRHWRVMVVDGTCLDVTDSPANQALGRAKSGRGEGVGAFPMVRVVGLVEAGTHAIVDAVQGPYASGEQTLARELARQGGPLGPGVLLLGDRLFVGAQLWRAMAGTGADLVWRVKCGSKTAPKLPVDQVLSDGSWLSRLYAASDRRKRHPIRVRVIEYTLSDPGRRTSVDRYRLVTTILDPTMAPAHELAALYTERWEIETALAELKTTQRGPRQVLRSRSPELVAQEVWAHLLVHYALRAVMHTAALAEDLDPDRLSFIRSLRVIRRQVIARPAFSP